MRKAILSITFTAVLLLTTATGALAQNDWDGLLDRYEQICDTCIELREMIGRGQSVPYSRISSVLEEMNSLRDTLKSTSSSMTPRQRLRFTDIRNKYARRFGEQITDSPQGREDLIPQLQSSSQEYARVLAERPLERGITSRGPIRKDRFVFGIMALADLTTDIQYGVSLSGHKGDWGGYLSAMSNFRDHSTGYSCTSSGQTSDGGVFWGDGTVSHSLLSASAGVSHMLGEHLGIHAGGGYWTRDTAWKDITDSWADVTDLTVRTFCAEGGLDIKAGMLALRASIRYVPSIGSVSAMAGLGIEF